MAITLLNYMMQTEDPVRKGLVQAVTNESAMLKLLNFIKVDGMAYHYGEQTALGGIAFRNLNANYAPGTGVINPRIETMAIFGGSVETDHQLINKQGDVARANAILAKVKRAGLFFDRYCIEGDPGVNPSQFYGLKPRLTGNQAIKAGDNGANPTLLMLDLLLDAVVGVNGQKVLLMSKYQRRKLKGLMQTQAGGATIADIQSTPATYDGARIEILDENGDPEGGAILPQTEACGTSNVTGSIYCIRPG